MSSASLADRNSVGNLNTLLRFPHPVPCILFPAPWWGIGDREQTKTNIMNPEEQAVIDALRDKGFAVIVWTPEELEQMDTSADYCETRSIELFSDYGV